jgi:hypothetical protein
MLQVGKDEMFMNLEDRWCHHLFSTSWWDCTLFHTEGLSDYGITPSIHPSIVIVQGSTIHAFPSWSFPLEHRQLVYGRGSYFRAGCNSDPYEQCQLTRRRLGGSAKATTEVLLGVIVGYRSFLSCIRGFRWMKKRWSSSWNRMLGGWG